MQYCSACIEHPRSCSNNQLLSSVLIQTCPAFLAGEECFTQQVAGAYDCYVSLLQLFYLHLIILNHLESS